MMNLFNYMIMIDSLMLLILMIPSYNHKFHPLTLSILLMFFSLMLVLKLNYLNSMYWYSYILFLLMIGGLMILFLYLTSVSNNEMFVMNFNYYFQFFMKIMFVFFFFNNILNINYEMKNLINYLLMSDTNMFMLSVKFNDFYFLKNLYLNFYISIYMLFYLFIVMISSVLICSKNCVPLRQMFNYEIIL